jgi:tRNA A-37 threonylcarbamoyl transferase component Bud32
VNDRPKPLEETIELGGDAGPSAPSESGLSAASCTQCGATLPAGARGSTCGRCDSLVAARTQPQGRLDAPAPASARSVRLALSQSSSERPAEEGERPAAQPDPLIGLVVAERYRILELLGRGGMGIVYKVEHARIGKLLAMKLLAGELSRNQQVVRRFKTEALTASKLSSPNTVQVFDYGASEGLTYLVMELVQGNDLGWFLRRGASLGPERIGRIVVQIASSLGEAHGAGIVHRDIKPENVMIVEGRDGGDVAKVLDFGLAKLREGSELSELTSAGAIVGTPYYMSPEQIRGDPVDARSDIYSLGALMYRALTGLQPFHAATPMGVFTRHLRERPEAPHLVVPDVPEGMSRIVMRALEKDAARRFQRVEELQAAVVEELESLGASGVKNLLDSGAVRRLASRGAAPAVGDVLDLATRGEVEAYERKLRRTRLGVTLAAAILPIAGAGLGAHYVLQDRPVVFEGREAEPNDTAAEANLLPYGRSIDAMVGKRLAADRGDVDFFDVTIPAAVERSSLTLAALPNMPICVQLFHRAQPSATAQYCTGRVGLDLRIPALRLEPGPWRVAVMQDLDPRGEGPAPYLHENVSDAYALAVGPAELSGDLETEPNDELTWAERLRPGQSVSGALAWVGDRDVVCAQIEAGERLRVRVSSEPRDDGGVLAVTQLVSGASGPAVETGVPVRVHVALRGKPSATDVQSPYVGPAITEVGSSCVVLAATADPLGADPTRRIARGHPAKYTVAVEEIR